LTPTLHGDHLPHSDFAAIGGLSGPLTATSSFAEPPRTFFAGSWKPKLLPRRRSTRARRRHPHPLAAGFLQCVSALPDPLGEFAISISLLS